MKVLSKSSEYGLRALLYMVGQGAGKDQPFISIRDMSETLDISFHFLTKILQNLTQAELLASYRGPNGGVGFKVPPEKITLYDVVLVLEGADYFDKCLLGLPGCGEQKPCPMHHFWKDIRGAMKQEFQSTTLAEMGRTAFSRSLRLAPFDV